MDPLIDPSVLMRIFSGFAISLLLFFVASRFLKKLPKTLVKGEGELFVVKSRQRLSANSSLLLIESCQKQYLLIENSGHFHLLDRLQNDLRVSVAAPVNEIACESDFLEAGKTFTKEQMATNITK